MENLHPIEYERISVKPLSSALGAVVDTVNLADLDEDTFDEIYHAYINYQILLFRNQTLTIDEYLEFSGRFGSLVKFPSNISMEEYLEVIEIRNDEQLKPFYILDKWLSDLSFLREPGTGSTAYCPACEGFGGDTLFSTQSLAYNSLSLTTQAILDNLKAVHSFNAEHLSKNYPATVSQGLNVHPVVRTLEDIGLKAIYTNNAFTKEIFGMTQAESQMLMSFLSDHVTQEAFTCRISWEANSLAIWDNRCVQHLNLFDAESGTRVIYKSIIQGTKPF